MNIVSMAMQYLTPMLVDRLATSLGIQSPLVRSAIAAILPSILGGLASTASQPGGGRKITDMLGRQNTDILGNLGDIFGGGKQAEVAKSGGDTLRDLLGGSAVSGLTSAVGKFTGVGDTAVQSLMGLVAPVALGTLAKHQANSGLDAAGMTKFLEGQKDNIMSAMPKGFADNLKGTGLLSAFEPAKPAARPAPTPTPAPSGGMGMMPMLLAAAALALGAYYFIGGKSATTTAALPQPPAITLGNQNIGAELGSVAEGLRGTLVGIKDEASAKAALPRLQQMSQQLGGLNESAAKLPAAGRSTLATYAKQILPFLRPLIDKALAASGVGAVAKPVLDQILNRIEGLSKA